MTRSGLARPRLGGRIARCRPGSPLAAVPALFAWLLAAVALPGLADPSSDPAAVVEAFHAALAAGDPGGAEALLAPDAIVLESGYVESRAEYVAHHLAADVEFARAVTQVRSDVRVVSAGDVAWVSARSKADGAMRGRRIHTTGAELMVLTRSGEGWRIRAIHWSSRERTAAADPRTSAPGPEPP